MLPYGISELVLSADISYYFNRCVIHITPSLFSIARVLHSKVTLLQIKRTRKKIYALRALLYFELN